MKLRYPPIKTLLVAFMAIIITMALAGLAAVFIADRLTLQAQLPLAPLAPLAPVTQVALAVILFVHVVGLSMAIMVYRLLADMVRAITDFATRVEQGDFAARFSTHAGAEVETVAQAINRMVERLNAALDSATAGSQRLALLVKATPAVIYAKRAGGDDRTTFITDNVQRCLGYNTQDFTENPGFWASRVFPEDLERAQAELASALQTGKQVCEYRFRHQDGSWRWLHDETVLLRDSSGTPTEFIGCWIDITEREALKESLLRRDAILRAVAYGSARFLPSSEEASDAQWQLAVQAVLAHLGEATGVSRVWIAQNTPAAPGDTLAMPLFRWELSAFTLPRSHFLFSSGFSFQQQGLSVEALRLRRGELVQLQTRDLPEPVRARFEAPPLSVHAVLLAPIQVSEQWWGMMGMDQCLDERGWSDTELEALRTAANLFGAAIGARATRQDLLTSLETLGSTLEKLKRQSAEIARQNTALLHANRVNAQLLNNVTHELRTPLNAIVGFAELLKEQVPGPLNAQQLEFANDILASGLRLTKQVDAMLELSGLDAESASLQRSLVDIGAALHECVDAHQQAAERRRVSIAVDVAPATGSAQLDPRGLRRMLAALLENAIKFNVEGGSVTLSARRDENAVEIAVADSGIGIAPENLDKLFKPLVQLDAGLARQYGGIGIGLALARRLAELQGGSIEVQSTLGKGSTFTLRLPVGGVA